MPLSDHFAATTLPQCIGRRAQRHGDRIAVTFVNDDGSEQSWSYQELWNRACCVASRLPQVDQCAPRGLLLFPPGIEFLAGFLGCQIAGWTPVPTCYPKARREIPRLDSAATDCTPSALISDRVTLDSLAETKLCAAARTIPRVVTDLEAGSNVHWIDPDSLSIDRDALALLQYTSGSTSEPKGVMVRHRNMMANLEAIRRGFHIDWQDDDVVSPDCGVFWLPFFHDMGLIGGILEPLYVGGRTVLISPRSFLQRPIRWLQCISEYGAMISGAPNFAFQLCVDRISPDQTDSLDLSRWRIAFSGAEPILARTLTDFANRFSSCGFSSSAFYPCYGLAEATLLAAGSDGPQEPKVLTVERESLGEGQAKIVDHDQRHGHQKLVGCGGASYQTELLVVDPKTCGVVDQRVVGEIWLKGASISDGYWNRDQENQEQFNAALCLSGHEEPGLSEQQVPGPSEQEVPADSKTGYCRTGDLGFLHDGHLYVTGRIKDLIILRGRNLFPQDIEATVRDSIGSEGGQCAAFAVVGARGEALAVVAELPRRADASTLPELVLAIRRAVIDVHEVDPRHVLLVRQTTVPLTSSGKVQRSRCHELFDADEIKTKYRYDRASGSERTPIAIPSLPSSPTPQDRQWMTVAIEKWMTEWLVVNSGIHASDVELEKPFADYGLDSMTAIELSGEIEDWSGVELTPVVAWNHPTISRLSSFIVDQTIGTCENEAGNPSASEVELEYLLDEIEQLSDDEIDHELAAKRRS